LIGTDFSNYFTEPEKAREGYKQVFEKGFVSDYPLTIRHINGKLTDVLYNASVYKDEKGNVLGVFAAARDITAQKQASQYARSLIEASLDPLVTISPEGKITDVNEASVKVTGVPREQLIGTDFSNYFTEPEKAREGYKQVFEKGFVSDYPLTIRHKNKKLTNVLYNASVYKDEKGNVLGVFAAARDVTEAKLADEKLKKIQAYTRTLIETSIDPLITKGPDGKISDVNKATETVTGYSREQLIGTHFPNYFTEPAKAEEAYQRAFEKGAVYNFPLTIKHVSGKTTDVLYNAAVYKDENGNVQGVFASARDITEQKQASQYARTLIESSLDPLVTISPEGKITDVNEALVEVTGVQREKLIGTDFSNYFTEPDKAREGYQQVLKLGFVKDYSLTIKNVNGKLTDVLYNASVYKDTNGNVLGVFAAARDVTAQKQLAEREVAEREKEMQRIAELEKFQKLTVGRELKMIELKKEIEELKKRVGIIE
jgi:PAS domain S-box-containing protein